VSTVLVIDVGTTSLRAAIVDDALAIVDIERRAIPPDTPFPGLVEFDAEAVAAAAIDAARAVLARAAAPVAAVGIANQRASTVVWDRVTGTPVGPALGWQDLRTVTECIVAKADHGLSLAPNQSATKVAWLLANAPGAAERDLGFGTLDTWLAWRLSGGAVHVTDHTNAATTGLLRGDASGWNDDVAATLGIPMSVLPALVPTSGVVAEASALPGAPAIAALCGDQQASLIGQGCVAPGSAKITFGTGGMLDVCTGPEAPASARRLDHGSFPIVARSHGRGDGVHLEWGVEAIMLSAGTNIEWLRDDLGLIDTAEATDALAASVASTDGVSYVPALLGLGTPQWDFGARGTLLGITRGSTRAHVVRAVLEGVAHRGADLVEAAEADTGCDIATIRVDGGMSVNHTFVQALADASGRPVEVSPVAEATTRGAAFLAGLAVGVWDDAEQAAELWHPTRRVEPSSDLAGLREFSRAKWHDAVGRASGWIPELSALEF
jgi:glycerol kinase